MEHKLYSYKLYFA